MSSNPINLTLRFVLELAALVALGYWGWADHQGLWQPLLGIGVPLVAAIVWGTFRVPGDPKDAPVPVPGWVRLTLEAVFFAAAVGLLAAADQSQAALIFGGVVLFHYALSYDRIGWLLRTPAD